MVVVMYMTHDVLNGILRLFPSGDDVVHEAIIVFGTMDALLSPAHPLSPSTLP